MVVVAGYFEEYEIGMVLLDFLEEEFFVYYVGVFLNNGKLVGVGGCFYLVEVYGEMIKEV